MNTRLAGMSARPSSRSRARRVRSKPTRSNRRMPSRRVSLHSSARHPASINVPYTGSHGSVSCHGVGDARSAKTAAMMACAPTAQTARANSISAGPRHVSVPASRRPTRAMREFGSARTPANGRSASGAIRHAKARASALRSALTRSYQGSSSIEPHSCPGECSSTHRAS